uniref:NADH dehydrogenase subunit 4 n=1 Tax=Cassianeura bimaculata TaxID=2932621 RepID=UPI001FF58B93|nr:NADH dehydrogenase subunit 4 [Cassianeura bimaculata]UOH96535.1 NADH dehydrogenase subunit 4 [Cassianeura bimaculata]
MMMTMFYMIFMIPFFFINLFNLWFMFQFSLILLMIFFCVMLINNYYSCLSYNLGIDYFSYGLIILSILIVSLMVIASNSIKSDYFMKLFLLMCLLLVFILFNIFSCLNMFMMYLYFEFSLIPLMILIYGWGYQPERLISGLYLFFYTLFASLPLFLLLIYFFFNSNSLFFDYNFGNSNLFLIHLIMMVAFLVKLPMFMVHFWLPKAHVQAPVSGSMILAGLLLKIGGYGILRFMFIYEKLFSNYSFIWYSMSIVGGVLVSFLCLIQGDVKCLIAYSSIAHMSLCLVGFSTMSKWGILGAYFMMISHGLCSSGLFCVANISYQRLSSRSFYLNKGLINFMPSLCLFWFMLSSFNMGCPPSLNFISEIFILNSMMMYWKNSFILFLMMSFFSACFSVYLFSYTQHGMLIQIIHLDLATLVNFLILTIHLLPIFTVVMTMNSLFI